MKKLKMSGGTIFLFLFAVLIIAGCQESSVSPDMEPTTEREAFLKMADEDEALASFEPNYNDEDVLTYIGKVNTEIYPFRVGHRISSVNRELITETIGDTTYGTVTQTFEGTLLIAASYSADSLRPDTVIQKPFTSVVTRKVIYTKIADTEHPMRNWRITAISLPEGGTLSSNIDITKLTVSFESGEQITITSPNDYFVIREQRNDGGRNGRGGRPGNGSGNGGGIGIGNQGSGAGDMNGGRFTHEQRRHERLLGNMPFIGADEEVGITVELTSAFADTDFVTITWGALPGGHPKSRRQLELVSEAASGSGYAKVYEGTFNMNSHPGFFHAVINAYPRQVIYDDAAPVEHEVWGIPYAVQQ